MIGTFENGQHYRFYEGLNQQIQALVKRLKHDRPDDLRHVGMDFSHVLESQLYFGTVLDQALNAMEAGLAYDGDAPLSSDLAVLLARYWFGEAAARPYERPENAVASFLRRTKRAFGWRLAWSAPRPKIAQSSMLAGCDILLYARSKRFADYLAPIRERLGDRSAYLVPAEAHGLQTELASKAIPFLAAGQAKARARPSRSLIGRYAPHLAFFAEGIEEVLHRTRPRVILLPEGNSPDDEVVNQVGKKLDIPVVCLQQGWSPILHPGFCNLDYAAMLVWGPGFADLLAATNPRQKFVPVGNYALASDFRPAPEKSPGVLFFHQDMDRGLGGRRGSDMLLDLAERIAVARPEIPVRYRPHPLVPLDDVTRTRLERRNIVIQKPQATSLAQALDQVSITVSIYSTTILESAAAGSLPVIFNMTTMPRFWPDIAEIGAGVEVHTTDEAMAALERLLADNAALASYVPAMRAFTDRFFCARGAEALDRVIKALDEIAAGP
jgi:hypothetical protein